ncbi:hypothetical protein ACJ8B8_02085, partial [Klebsiella pneumoniae]
MTAINVQPTLNAVMCGINCLPTSIRTLWAHATKGQRRDERPHNAAQPHSVINNPSIELAAAQTVDIPGNAATWTADYLNSDYSWIPRIILENCIPAIIHAPGAKA